MLSARKIDHHLRLIAHFDGLRVTERAHDPASGCGCRHNPTGKGSDFLALPDLAAPIVADAAAGRQVQMNIVQM
jgi:hypothetical protein